MDFQILNAETQRPPHHLTNSFPGPSLRTHKKDWGQRIGNKTDSPYGASAQGLNLMVKKDN